MCPTGLHWAVLCTLRPPLAHRSATPGVGSVERNSVLVSAANLAGPFLCLLDGVMARPAKRLPIRLVPEQRQVAMVRHDVIDHRRDHVAAPAQVKHAERVVDQEDAAQPPPSRAVEASSMRSSIDSGLTTVRE